MLKELENEENEHIKKVYNVKLLNWLEAQESQREINAEFKNGFYSSSKMKQQRYEMGQHKRFMKKLRNPNDKEFMK